METLNATNTDTSTVAKPESRNELFSALAKAQAEFTSARQSEKGNFDRYSTIGDMINATRLALTKHGLSILHLLEDVDGKTFMVTVLAHSSGQMIETRMRIIQTKPDMQGLGAAITYAKRYSYSTLVCLDDRSEDLDDVPKKKNAQQSRPLLEEVEEEETEEIISSDEYRILKRELSTAPHLEKSILERLSIDGIEKVEKRFFNNVLDYIRKAKETESQAKKPTA